MSILSKVLLNFGFSNQESQIALLNIFNIAGYFSDEKIWQAISLMDFNQNGQKTASNWRAGELETFKSINQVLQVSKANSETFDAKYFLENAFNQTDIFEQEDVEDLLLYLGQEAFGRRSGQERSDLIEHDWMRICKEEYLKNAEIIGFIKEKKPHHQKYDESWIQGGARSRLISRINYLKKIKDQKIDLGLVRILTGIRELSLELDVISDEQEVKDFICEVAADNGIEYDLKNPFIKKNFGQSVKTCLNYLGNCAVSETMMAKKIYRKIFGEEVLSVIDSAAEGGIGRPTTEKNAHDIIEGDLFLRIKNGDFEKEESIKIMIVSNQPYCNRQSQTITRAALDVMNKKLSDGEINHQYQLIFDGVGEESKSPVVQIHSVLGALISEDFLITLSKNNRKRKIENLMFSSRYRL